MVLPSRSTTHGKRLAWLRGGVLVVASASAGGCALVVGPSADGTDGGRDGNSVLQLEAARVAVGVRNACFARDDGRVACWGRNDFGTVAPVDSTAALAPITRDDLQGVVALAAAHSQTCALRTDGRVACWGWVAQAQSGGHLDWGPSTTPVLVAGVATVVQVVAGDNFVCGRSGSGGASCWGSGNDGALGDGVDRSTPRPVAPVSVAGLSDAVQLAAGDHFACARRRGGTVACWGVNDAGQLGIGMTSATPRTAPVPVAGLTGVVQIAAGSAQACAVRSDGSVACWGHVAGEAPTTQPTPTPVAGLTDVTTLALGLTYACALRNDGTVWCWGQNDRAQLGDGTRTTRATPAPVAGLTDVVELAAYWAATCARRRSGAVDCWGDIGFGMAVDPRTGGFAVPTQVVAR